MGSPVDPLALADCMSDMRLAVNGILSGDYSAAEKCATKAAQDQESAAFVICTCLVTIASLARSLGDPEKILTEMGRRSVGAAFFMEEVLNGIDDLPGDPQEDAFHGD
jgi:hypothetical protein